MNALVPALTFTSTQLSLIRKTVAKDANDVELNWFVEFCKLARLNPLRRQCFLFIFHKNNPAKRNPVVVTAIDGLRAIADRSGNYRPDASPPKITYDEKLKGDLNPLGILKAQVNVFKWVHGEWHSVAGEAHWMEFAPVRDVWADDEATGKRVKTDRKELDPGKEGWTRMPNLMIAKVAEAQALRKAWPEDLSAVYGEEELDNMKTIELTATEMADDADRADRLERVGGGANSVMIDWMDGEPLQRVPVGQFFDQAMAFVREHMKKGEEEPSVVMQWRAKNAEGLREFWAHEKDAALELKKELERIEAATNNPAN